MDEGLKIQIISQGRLVEMTPGRLQTAFAGKNHIIEIQGGSFAESVPETAADHILVQMLPAIFSIDLDIEIVVDKPGAQFFDDTEMAEKPKPRPEIQPTEFIGYLKLKPTAQVELPLCRRKEHKGRIYQQTFSQITLGY